MRLPFFARALCLVASPALARHVPFVGCASDGQAGSLPVPHHTPTPDLAPAAAARLAYYVGPYSAVLAPRGWHCLQAYGSNGDSLYVAPRIIRGLDDLTFSGPAVQMSTSEGGTSGRFDIAKMAARLFPAAKAFVDHVEAEGRNDKPFVRGPYPADKITYRGPYEALVTTPAGAEGIGTQSRLRRGALPIDSIVIYQPSGDISLLHMAARLTPAQRPLVATIVSQVKQENEAGR